VRWAVDHALRDQRGPPRSDGFDTNAELTGYVAGAMGPCTEVGHGLEVELLRGGKPVHAHQKEVFVELASDEWLSPVDCVKVDR